MIIIFTLNNHSRCISGRKLDQQIHWWVFFFSPSWSFPSSLAGLAPLQPPPPPLQQVTFKLCFCNFFALKTPTPSLVHFNRNSKSDDMQLESTTHHTSATTTTTCSGASATCPTGYTKDSDGTKCYIRRWFSMIIPQETVHPTEMNIISLKVCAWREKLTSSQLLTRVGKKW